MKFNHIWLLGGEDGKVGSDLNQKVILVPFDNSIWENLMNKNLRRFKDRRKKIA